MTLLSFRRSPLQIVVRSLSWVGAAAVLATPFFSPGSPVSLVRVAVEQPVQLAISGSIEGLRPAVPASLTLTLASSAEQAVLVRSVAVRVTGASAGCPAEALSVDDWSGELTVPPHGRAAAKVRVVLDDPDGQCEGATWQLAYTSA